MFMKHDETDFAHHSAIMEAAQTAARAVPPAFPLNATVAVNPFLGQVEEDIATASTRLERVAGAAALQDREAYCDAIADGRITDADLQAALVASKSMDKPADIAALKALLKQEMSTPRAQALATIAHLAAAKTHTDWPSIIEKTIGLWAAGYFDRGQALWSAMPGESAYASWRAWASHDLTPEVAGLSGFCAHVMAAPDTAERAILRAVEKLDLTPATAQSVFHRLLMDLSGWSQHARWMLWQAELAGGQDTTAIELLAIRLVWEEALLGHAPQSAQTWAQSRADHASPLTPTPQTVALAIAQEAAEHAYQRSLINALDGTLPNKERPTLQAAFCIDVRSEVFRRALESVNPAIETIGFAGFFGLPLAHKSHGSDVVENHLPVLLNPAIETTSHAGEVSEQKTRIAARAARAWGRFRQAAVSSFAFVEAAGPLYASKLIRDALGISARPEKADPVPQIVGGLSAEQKTDTAATVLKAMSLTGDHGKIVLLLGHGGNVTNNPHESAYHCGACGGHTGEVSARLLAVLLSDPETRAGLKERGMPLPDDTLFVAGLHDTTTDDITIYEDVDFDRHSDAMKQVRAWLAQAGRIARAERAVKLHGSTADTLNRRAANWAQVRPEWGLAGCAAFIAAPRSATAGKDLGGRTFLHSYDWRADTGFATLELILTAPVVVASWISLQYYGSAVAPDVFGGGNKLIHNVVGGFGVIEGNSGRLRPGLPWQAVHDGDNLVHDPLRLTVMIEAPREAITEILKKHPPLRALFDNGWLHLFTLEGGRIGARYRPGLKWKQETNATQNAIPTGATKKAA